MNAVFCAVLAGLCWGIGELFTKSVLHSGQVGPMTILLVRALVTVPPAVIAYLLARHLAGAAAEGAALRPDGAAWWRTADGVVLAKLAAAGLLAGFGGVFFFYTALSLPGGDISRIKPIAFTLAPAIAVLLGWALLKEPMSVRKGVAIAMILGGVWILTFKPTTAA